MLRLRQFRVSISLVFLVTTACIPGGATRPVLDAVKADSDPLDTTYSIDGQEYTLRDGYFEKPAAPDSASKISVTVLDVPAYGDLDEDSHPDAAVILVYQGGGSGSFYYLAVALGDQCGYRGTNALLLGDRVVPQRLQIQNKTVVTRFSQRRPAESMATTPSIDETRYAFLDGRTLTFVATESVQPGWISYGHEVRIFLPCDDKREHWLLGQSPALAQIASTYYDKMKHSPAYAPLFVVLNGRSVDPPREGFGADYSAAFVAERLLEVNASGNCREQYISIEIPQAGALIESPLAIRGRARGSWFFEGDFPVVLEDAEGNVIARSFVTAQGEWMTREFVAFSGTLTFTKPAGLHGNLVLKKDNPSDRRELDDSTAIPVLFHH